VAVASAGPYASHLHLAERASDQQLAGLLIVFVLLLLITEPFVDAQRGCLHLKSRGVL